MNQHRSTKPTPPSGDSRVNSPPTSSAVPRIAGRRKALFAAVLLLGAVALGEGFCRLFLHNRPDAVWRLEQAQFAKTGFPSLASVLEFDPALFWRLRPGLAGFELVAEKYYPAREVHDLDGRALLPPDGRATGCRAPRRLSWRFIDGGFGRG